VAVCWPLLLWCHNPSPGVPTERSGSDANSQAVLPDTRQWSNGPRPHEISLNVLIRHFVPLFSHTSTTGQENARRQYRGTEGAQGQKGEDSQPWAAWLRTRNSEAWILVSASHFHYIFMRKEISMLWGFNYSINVGKALRFPEKPGNLSLKTNPPPPHCKTPMKLVQGLKAFQGNFRQSTSISRIRHSNLRVCLC